MRTKKLDFLRTLGRSKSFRLYRCAKKREIHAARAKNADCTCTHSTKNKIQHEAGRALWSATNETGLDFAPKHFNLVPSFPGYEIAQRLIFLLIFFFHSVTIAILKLPIYKRISLRLHPLLHPITLSYIRSAVALLGLPASALLFLIFGLSTVVISDSNLAKDVALDCSKACIYFVHWSRHIPFTSWLDNIGTLRCSTAEIGSYYDHVLTLSAVLCQVNAAYLYHHLRSETRPTGYSMGVTIRLESRFGQASGARKGEKLEKTTRRKHPAEIPKAFKVSFFYQIRWLKPYLLNVGNRQDDIRYFWRWFSLS